MELKRRDYKYDYLRVLCCFLIVVLHFSSSYWDCVSIHSREFYAMTIYNCITRVGVPIFIMLSGCFLLRKNEEELLGRNYFKRPLKLLFTVYLWSAFYAFQGPVVEFIRTGTVSQARIEKTISDFIFGHYHMWFCFLIIGYYFLLPIAKMIASNIRVLRLFLMLWIIISFVIPCVFSWLNLPSVLNYFGIYETNMVKGFWGYFLLGYYLDQELINKNNRIVLYFGGIVSYAITLGMTLYQCVHQNEYVTTWFGPSSPFVLIMAASVFLLFRNMKELKNQKMNRLMQIISEVSFFVYMFHVFLLEKLNLVGITTISFPSILSVPVLSLMAFVFSVIVALCVKRIPIIGKILLHS